MTQKEINENIEIARRYLNSFHLLLPDDEVLFDCYCLPSFGTKAFYAQITIKNGVYRAGCAYTHYADHLGNKSSSRNFADIEKDDHPARKNDVFCKIIFPKPETVDSLISIAQKYTDKATHPKGGVIIDGMTAGIRSFDKGSIIRDIAYTDPDGHDMLLDALCAFSDMI